MTALITTLLVLISVLAVSGTVLSQSSAGSREQKEYYRMLEQEYVKSVQDYLEEQGYVNSGVTMNRMIEADGSMEYTVTIHHRRISALDPAQRDELVSGCREIAFPIAECIINHAFLETFS